MLSLSAHVTAVLLCKSSSWEPSALTPALPSWRIYSVTPWASPRSPGMLPRAPPSVAALMAMKCFSRASSAFADSLLHDHLGAHVIHRMPCFRLHGLVEKVPPQLKGSHGSTHRSGCSGHGACPGSSPPAWRRRFHSPATLPSFSPTGSDLGRIHIRNPRKLQGHRRKGTSEQSLRPGPQADRQARPQIVFHGRGKRRTML